MKAIENHKVNGKEIVYKEDAEDILHALIAIMEAEGGEPNYDNQQSVESWELARKAIKKATLK